MPRSPESRSGARRAATGIAQLDQVIDGGYPLHRAVVVCGPPGAGKTIIGLQFLVAGFERGESGIFVACDEKPRHLLEDARAFGWDLDAPRTRGAFALLDASPGFAAARDGARRDLDAREVAADLTREVRATKADRLVIDTITSLVPPGLSPEQTDGYLRTLIQSLEDNLQCTILLTCRAPEANQSCRTARYLAAGIIELGFSRQRQDGGMRVLRVLKMRATSCDLVEHPFVMAPRIGLLLGVGAVDRVPLHTAAAIG